MNPAASYIFYQACLSPRFTNLLSRITTPLIGDTVLEVSTFGIRANGAVGKYLGRQFPFTVGGLEVGLETPWKWWNWIIEHEGGKEESWTNCQFIVCLPDDEIVEAHNNDARPWLLQATIQQLSCVTIAKEYSQTAEAKAKYEEWIQVKE